MFGDSRVVGDVIEVPVREPQADEIPIAAFDLVEHFASSVIRRIEQHRLFGRFVRDHKAVGLCHAAGVGENNHKENLTTEAQRAQRPTCLLSNVANNHLEKNFYKCVSESTDLASRVASVLSVPLWLQSHLLPNQFGHAPRVDPFHNINIPMRIYARRMRGTEFPIL